MKSETTDQFWALYRSLPVQVRKQARQAYLHFVADPFRPGLNFEEVDQRRHLWSARISRSYRVLGYREHDTISWFWIGSHREYEKLISSR